MSLRILGVAAAGLMLNLVGSAASPYRLDVLTSLFLFMTVAMAWNILAGFSRQFSLGVSAFVGSGAYAAALVSLHLGWGPVRMVLAGGLTAAVLAGLLSVALLRLRDDYFTIGSLAAALAVQAVANNTDALGGSAGLNLPFDNLPTPMGVYRLAVACVVLASLATVWLMSGTTGQRMSAVGQHEAAAVTLGVNVQRLRLGSLILSAALTGLAGAVVAIQQVNVEPLGTLSFTWTIAAVVMTLIGGVGTFGGPVLGSVVVYLGLTKQLASYPIAGLVIEALVLLVVVRVAPRGLWPMIVSVGSSTARGLARVASSKATPRSA